MYDNKHEEEKKEKGEGDRDLKQMFQTNLHFTEKVCPPSTAAEGLIIIGKQNTVKLLWHIRSRVHKN